MGTGADTTLYISYGVSFRVASLLFAAQVLPQYDGALLALEIILLRCRSRSKGTITSATEHGEGASAVERVPVEVWEAVLAEVREAGRREMREAELDSLAKATCAYCREAQEEAEKREKRGEGETAGGKRWFDRDWEGCEECLEYGRREMLRRRQENPAEFLAAYGLQVVQWPYYDNYELEEPPKPDPLHPFASVVVELPADEETDAGAAGELPRRLDTWAPPSAPPVSDSTVITLDMLTATDRRKGLFLCLLRDWGVELTDKESEGRPALHLRMESILPY